MPHLGIAGCPGSSVSICGAELPPQASPFPHVPLLPMTATASGTRRGERGKWRERMGRTDPDCHPARIIAQSGRNTRAARRGTAGNVAQPSAPGALNCQMRRPPHAVASGFEASCILSRTSRRGVGEAKPSTCSVQACVSGGGWAAERHVVDIVRGSARMSSRPGSKNALPTPTPAPDDDLAESGARSSWDSSHAEAQMRSSRPDP